MTAGKLLRGFHPSLAQRIVFWFLLMVMVPTLLLALITDRLSSESLRKKVHEQLVVLAEAKANRLETYAFERTRAASVLGRVRRLSNAAMAFQKVGADVLDRADTETDIRTVAYYFMENLGFTNLILLAPQGDVLFQTQNQLPLGDNLLRGPLGNSELAKVVKRAMTLLEPDISNFAMYSGMDQPLGFVAGPIVSEAGRLVGLLVLQLNTQEVFETFGDYTGLGRTGYTAVATLQGDEVRIVAPLRHHPDAAFNLSVRLGDPNGQIIQKAMSALNVEMDFLSNRMNAFMLGGRRHENLRVQDLVRPVVAA